MAGVAKVRTGIQGLDSQIGGGVPAGSTLLVIAESTNALYQLLEEIAGFGLRQGEQVLWFELDRPYGLMKDGLDRTSKDGKGELTILDGFEPRMGPNSTNGSGASLKEVYVGEMPALLSELVAGVEPNNYRVIFSSLSSLLQSHSPSDTLQMLRQAQAFGQSLGGLQIFTLIKDAHPKDQVALFKNATTGVFEIGMERKGFGIYSYLRIEKLLGVTDAARLMLFQETPQGLRLESTRRVF